MNMILRVILALELQATFYLGVVWMFPSAMGSFWLFVLMIQLGWFAVSYLEEDFARQQSAKRARERSHA